MTSLVMAHGTRRQHCRPVVDGDPKEEVSMNRVHWLVPALGSLAFLVFSIVVATREGPFGFIVEHSRNGWSAQITIDLVTSMLIAILFVAPVARRVGVRMAPWVVLILLTGSIGLLALVARVRYAQTKEAVPGTAGVSPAHGVA
jgi:hypothetical protein